MENFTEQEVAEEFGVELEDHGGGDPGPEGGSQNPEEPGGAAEDGKGAEQTQAEGQTGEDAGGQEPPPPQQSAEERHRQAAARRAREDQARAAAEQARVDQVYERMFAGQKNPYTGQPIRTEAEYRAYEAQKARQEQEDQLRHAGIDPGTIEGIVNQQMAPVREQMQAAQMAAAQERARAVNARAQETIAASLKTIAAWDSSIKSLEDIAAMPTAGRFNELVQKGVGMEDAFYLANRKAIEDRKVAAATAAARNGAASRTHLDPVQTGGGQLPVEVPADQAEMFREMMPDASDAEIQKAYASYLKDLGK